jgi:PAP2 superfamily
VTLVSPGQDVFAGPIDYKTKRREGGQLNQVLQWAELREERSAEILAQIENQHVMWGTLIPLHAERMRATRELIEAAIQMSIYVQTRFKHELACWRPMDYSPQVQPMITTPGHGSLPSGHCTQAYVIYNVLKHLLQTDARDDSKKKSAGVEALNRQFKRMAERVSTNRVVAGVHFPVDNVAGRLLGVTLGEYFVRRCGQKVGHYIEKTIAGDENPCQRTIGWIERKFIGPRFPADGEFNPEKQNLFNDTVSYYPSIAQGELPDAAPAEVMKAMWQRAQDECRKLGLVFDKPTTGQPFARKIR